jgi:hypothetical protein
MLSLDVPNWLEKKPSWKRKFLLRSAKRRMLNRKKSVRMLSRFDRKLNKHLVTDSLGKGLTIALFHETNDGRTDIKSIWSLKDWKEVYLDLLDPTEYEPAMYLLGDWLHWKRIADASACAPFIAQWREELKVKMKSLAIAELRKQAKGKMGTAAAKWLVEHTGEDKKSKKQRQTEDFASFEEKLVLANAERLKSA